MTAQWVVVKFGGTSVASATSWLNIAQIIRSHLASGERVLVVCSALSGISNHLESLLTNHTDADETLATIKTRYESLMQDLQVDCQTHLSQQWQQLQQLIAAIQLSGATIPSKHAEVMAFGELLLTHLGVAYLQRQGINAYWQDARECLLAKSHDNSNHTQAYLNAHCDADYDAELVKSLEAMDSVVVTQGFIASNYRGETVLLGRGGSDTSAAYFASKLAALRCEIWTDVPGIYTANPREIPQARMIKSLDYDEAQEIASMGAKVLHPRCIAPVSLANIPIHVRYTLNPERMGTEIYTHQDERPAQIKSILIKRDVILLSIETLQMWQQVGFLAEVFQCVKRHGISIDLISSSEASVTLSLDVNTRSQEKTVLDALLADLNQFAKATMIMPCASVSLVGRHIRAILHQLGDVFTVFEEQKVYLLSQAANDLNLTFVVDEDQALRLAMKLHRLLIEQKQLGDPFHLPWIEEFGDSAAKTHHPWWIDNRDTLLALAKKSGTPSYCYSQQQLQQSLTKLLSCDAVDAFFYSIKANNHADVLRYFYDSGLGFESVSIEELHYLLELFPEIDRKRLLFTPNFAEKSEYQRAIDLGVWITIDNLYPLQAWGSIFSGQSVLIRVDIGRGSGHHKHVVTGGDQSKFGIPLKDLASVKKITEEQNIKVLGLHSHAGSGILDSQHWQAVFSALAQLVEDFPTVKIINVGGGLGIVERPGQQALDMSALNASLQTVKAKHPQLQLWMEPGRYLVAQAGVLLTKVTQVKHKNTLQFVGVDTGMNSLIRPALYGSYHEIVNLTRLHEKNVLHANVVGPICETGDTLGYSRYLPCCEEGDVMLVANVGAYGYTMSSHYNLRQPAKEQILE